VETHLPTPTDGRVYVHLDDDEQSPTFLEDFPIFPAVNLYLLFGNFPAENAMFHDTGRSPFMMIHHCNGDDIKHYHLIHHQLIHGKSL